MSKYIDGFPFYIPASLAEKTYDKIYHVLFDNRQRACARWCKPGVWREPVSGDALPNDLVTGVYTNPSMWQLQSYIHNQNVAVGWWDNPRDYSTMSNLFHSEASEALEGHRKSLPDDKLGHYPMHVVEAADLAIRILDYLGSISNTKFTDRIERPQYLAGDFQHNLAMCHYWLSQAWFNQVMVGNSPDACLRHTLRLAMHIIEDNDYNPIQIILEKVEYNRTRADHQRENRQGKPGQKEY